LFYHPVVRWISRDVRRERELCCDDSAVQACGDALHYAHALTDLEQLRGADLSPALGVNGGDLMMRVERLIAPHHAAVVAPRLTSVMLVSALCLGGMLALASARNMPLSALQNFNLPLPSLRALATAQTPAPALPAARLAPTELTPGAPRAPRPAPLQPAQFDAPTLQEVSAPSEPPAAAPAQPAVPVQMGGEPLSTLLSAGAKEAPTALELNKQAQAQMKVINLRVSTPAANSQHDYCEPITGSRVCN